MVTCSIHVATFTFRSFSTCSTIGVVVSWVVAIDSTRVRFPDGAVPVIAQLVERLTVDQLVTSSILVDRTSSVADRKGRMTVYFYFVAQHHWCSGIMGRCHRLDPGSIPGWCIDESQVLSLIV